MLQDFDLETEDPLKSINDLIVSQYAEYYNLNELIEIAALYCNLQEGREREFNYAVKEFLKRNDVLRDSNLITNYAIPDLLSGGVGDLSSKIELNPKLISEFLQGLKKMESIYSGIIELFKK